MRNDTVVIDRSTPNDNDLLRWLNGLEGVAEDHLHDGLLVDESGRAVPLSLDYAETTWSAHPRTGHIISLDVGAETIFGHPILELRRSPALLFEAILPEDRWVLLDLVKIRDFGGSISRKFRILAGKDQLKWVLADAMIIRNQEGRAVRIEGLIRDITAQKIHEDEISRMNEDLEHRVQKRTQALKESQEKLLESEKMAALGRLVASVTHEINTPIGIGVTAASHLQDKLATMRACYDSGKMKRSDFEHFLSDSDNISQMILTNLDKAARLIQGFKGVAVDQSDEARRRFDLAEYLEEIMLSLRPRFKHTEIGITIDCPADIIVDSYPGALSQVVTNLMMNAMIHGYEHTGNGTIEIHVEQTGERIILRFHDDGAGMTDENRRKIFEPFFTTKRSQGGSGLGTHVVYTAVTESLGGTIVCESVLGQGTTFIIEFPQIRGGDDE